MSNVSETEDKSKLSQKLEQLLAPEIQAMNEVRKSRLMDVIGVFAKHNFYAGGMTPYELRTTLEDLGPTYVKIGQIMSSRVDLLPKEFCDELGTLRSNVKPLDPQVARAVIEAETGKKIEDMFSEFRDEPLGSASIAQAHYGVLLDGTKVVTKVQRPLIGDMMREDFVLLKKLASLLGSSDDEEGGGNTLDLKSVIDELAVVTEEELDFRVEGGYTRFFKENCIEDENVVNCPSIIDELSTSKILTMTFVDGCSISKKEKLIEQGCDLNELGKAITENYIHQVLDVGTFHGDPHQGNIMVSNRVPYWIDFGMMGHISENSISLFSEIITCLLGQDMEGMTNAIMSLGVSSSKTNRVNLMEDIDAFINRYSSVSTLGELDTAKLLGELTELATNNHITLPSEYTMLVRGLATIEGVIEELCPDLNLFKVITDKLMGRIKQSFDLKQTLLSAGKDSVAAGKKAAKIPSLLSDTLSTILKGRTKVAVELTGYEEIMKQIRTMFGNGVLAFFSCMMFIGSSLLLLGSSIMGASGFGQSAGNLNMVSIIGIFGLLFSIALGIYTLKKIRKQK